MDEIRKKQQIERQIKRNNFGESFLSQKKIQEQSECLFRKKQLGTLDQVYKCTYADVVAAN